MSSKTSANSAKMQRKWERSEVCLLVVEYFKTKKKSKEEQLISQQSISQILRRKEEIRTGKPLSELFRNTNGIALQTSRIRCLDPETPYSGMVGTKLQKEIIKEYLINPKKIEAEASELLIYKEKKDS